MNKSWTTHEKFMSKAFASQDFLTFLGGLVGGGWLKFLLILRLSQPSLAGVGAGAELGKKMPPKRSKSKETLTSPLWAPWEMWLGGLSIPSIWVIYIPILNLLQHLEILALWEFLSDNLSQMSGLPHESQPSSIHIPITEIWNLTPKLNKRKNRKI